MKVSIKRTIALLASAVMISGLLASCASQPTPAGETTDTPAIQQDAPGGLKWPLVEKPTTFTILAHSTTVEDGPGAWETPNQIPFYADYEKKTNVNIEWEVISYDAWTERMNVLIAGGDMPDAMLKGKVTDTDLIKNGAAGSFVNLSDLIPKYAPNFNSILEQYDGAKYITLGGGIYGMPYVLETESIRVTKPFINGEWLAMVNKKAPTTVEELLDVLRAFRDADTNGDGDISDETPFGATSIANLYPMFYDLFGLRNRGTGNIYIDADPTNAKKVRFYRGADEMKDILKIVKQMYSEKLINTNIFTTEAGTQYYSDATANKIGLHMAWSTVVGPELVDKFEPFAGPLKNSEGKQLWGQTGSLFSSKGAFVITSTCKQPEVLLSWVDYFYSDEGAAGYLLGTEGVSYTKGENGALELTETITKNPDGLDQEQALLRYSLGSGGQNPSKATDNTFKGGETHPTSIKGTENFKPFMIPEVWYALPMQSTEQAEKVSTVKPDIDTVIVEFEAKFVEGTLDIDKDWDKYQAALKTAGVDKYIAVYQELVDTLVN